MLDKFEDDQNQAINDTSGISADDKTTLIKEGFKAESITSKKAELKT